MKNEKGFLGFGASGFSGEKEEIKEHPHWKYKPYWENGQVKYELHMLSNEPMEFEDPGPVPELVRQNAVRQTDKESLTADKSFPPPVLQGNDRQQTERQTNDSSYACDKIRCESAI